ncbi:MAG: hypothetical protein IJF16_07730, partial [Clostridia bacterium]|nr:hypothetical protein [Clostridia bacterium]
GLGEGNAFFQKKGRSHLERPPKSLSDIAFGCDMRLAARDMCARGLFLLIKLTNSSAVINFANGEYAHAKYLLTPSVSLTADSSLG